MEKKGSDIILCQPDAQKGCSACCGLLNLADISKENLSVFLAAFNKRKCMPAAEDASWAEKFRVRDATAHICPYQGFIDKDRPGCMVLQELSAENGRDMSIFGAGVCGDYICPAYSILDDEYKRILAGYIDDWYLYTISIADPESFIWIVDTIRNYFSFNFTDNDSPEGKRIKEAMRSAITRHSEFLNSKEAPVFQYSVSEYNLYKDSFTLNSKLEGAARLGELIVSDMEKILLV